MHYPLDGPQRLGSEFETKSFALLVVPRDSFEEFGFGGGKEINAGYFLHVLIFSKTDSSGVVVISPRS